MDVDEITGECVHPVHNENRYHGGGGNTASRTPVVQTYSSALGGYHSSSGTSRVIVHRAKRMRMYYP